MSAPRKDSPPRTLWEAGRRPGRQVATLSALALVPVLLVNLVVADRLNLVFDLGFAAICAVAALVVRPRDFFVVGVLPPLLLCGAALLLSVIAPGSVGQPADGPIQSTISTLAHHAGALVVGYGLTLVILALRQAAIRGRLPAQSAARRRETASPYSAIR